ncbi:hypothetical protein E4T48_06589 [Aureobasidium sp. EXF-10727]|nr:hypothetical protein E4T48_06589 [Aureobasidium sp. EXF-10727]
MPSLLAPRLRCFYCGMRSPHVKDGRTRQFVCTSCEATNHLDSKGDITDPPATPSSRQNASFAHPPQRPTSPVQPESSNLFCKTCLKNQHMVTTLLAEYLPAENDPHYQKYEAEYPQYRKDLERRFPQVCPRCAPKVEQHLKRTNYVAKADFLTRNLERSKAHAFNNLPTSSSLAISGLSVVAVAWWASALFQAYWHALAFLGIPGDNQEVANLTPLMVVGCSVNGLRLHFLPAGCPLLFVTLVKKSLYLSFWLLWWNPTFKDRLRFPYRTHQAVGLADFYRYQFAILVLRATAWWYLSGPWIDGSASDITKGMHGCTALFIILSTIASLRTVVYSSAPRVSWKTSNEPLLEPGSFHPPNDDFISQASPHLPTMSPSRQPFPLENLGSHRVTRSETLAAAASPILSRFPRPSPSPGPAQDMEDSMDWEPINQSSPIRPNHTTHLQAASALPPFLRPAASMATGEKSPFTGRLPPAPMSPAHRLRNPPPPPQFKPTPLSQQRDFFQKMGLSSASVPSLSKKPVVSEDHEDEDSPRKPATFVSSLDRNRTKDHFELHPGKWTLKSDMEAAEKGTGLEDMFNTSFKIADPTTPKSLRRTAAAARSSASPTGTERRHIFDHNPIDPVTDETPAEIVMRNAKEMALPVGLALAAAIAAWARDPGAREWMAGVWSG